MKRGIPTRLLNPRYFPRNALPDLLPTGPSATLSRTGDPGRLRWPAAPDVQEARFVETSKNGAPSGHGYSGT